MPGFLSILFILLATDVSFSNNSECIAVTLCWVATLSGESGMNLKKKVINVKYMELVGHTHLAYAKGKVSSHRTSANVSLCHMLILIIVYD